MKKQFKMVKRSLAYVLALTVLAVSLFTGTMVTASAATISQWDGATFDSELSGGGEKNNPYLITNAAEFAAVCYGKATGSKTGAYFKVEGVDEFYLDNVSSPATVKALATPTDVKNYYSSMATTPTVWQPNTTLELKFDGNGAVVYGLYTVDARYPGLFPAAVGLTDIENIAVKNSYVVRTVNEGQGYDYSGFIIATGGFGNDAGIINIRNCMAINNYSYSLGGIHGEIVGHGANSTINISNCIAADNVLWYNANPQALPFQYYVRTSNNTQGSVTNCIGIDVVPKIRQNASVVSNTYWDGKLLHSSDNSNGITAISSVNLAKGMAAKTAMANLSANDWFFNDTTYPEPAVFHTLSTNKKDNLTHITSCSDCSLTATEAHNADEDGKCVVCGYEPKCGEKVSVYSGTPDTTTTLAGDGSKDSPYIIATADQFAAIALGKRTYDQGSYFKVDNNIDAFYINGGATVAAMTNVADVEAYFVANGGYDWVSSWDNATANKSFSGHFDGNGVTIYGLYDVGSNSGLFEMAEDESSFKNFALKNSYIKVGSGAGVAAIVGKVSKQSDPDIMTFENIVVANNHIEQTNTSSNVGASPILGYIYNNNDGVKINNCIIYDNNIVNPNQNATRGLVSIGGNGNASLTQITNVISLGVKPFTAGAGYYLRVLDANRCFVNVYTDQDCSAMNNYSDKNKETFNFKDNLSVSDLQGIKAIETADVLEWEKIWFATNGLPTLRTLHDSELNAVDNLDGTHSEACSCGLKTLGTSHVWGDNDGECSVCGATCAHENFESKVKTEATCTEAAWYYDVCKDCGLSSENIEDGLYQDGEALGHAMVEVPGTAAKCGVAGVKPYYDCSRCDYVSEDSEGAVAITEDLATWKVIPALEHIAAEDENGIIYKQYEDKHCNVCAREGCGVDFNEETCKGVYVEEGAEGCSGKCNVCGVETAGVEKHTFNDEYACSKCGWSCGDNHLAGEVVVENETDSTCAEAGSYDEATYCTVCGKETSRKTTTKDLLAHDWSNADGICVTCGGECEHENVESVEKTPATCTEAAWYYDVCNDCGLSSEDMEDGLYQDGEALGHTDSMWMTDYSTVVQSCTQDGSHEEYTICEVCFEETDRKTVEDEKTGHDLYEYSEIVPNCSSSGNIAHLWCANCNGYFAPGADIYCEDYIAEEDVYLDVDLDVHTWVEVEAIDATCDDAGNVAYSYCRDCYLLNIGDETTALEIDWDAFWAEDGAGTLANQDEFEAYETAWAEFLAEQGLEQPAEPGEDATPEEWDEYFAALGEFEALIDYDAWNEYWMPIYDSIWSEVYLSLVIEAAEAVNIEIYVEAKGHELTKVDEVAATYDKEGTKAHYVCECGKLYADAEGKTEVTAEELVIAKLVKEEVKEEAKDETVTDETVKDEAVKDDVAEEETEKEDTVSDEETPKTESSTNGDTSDKAPATGESIAIVFALILIGFAMFVSIKKIKSR